MQPHSLYLHVPFCTHRCGYCDFNTYAGLEHLMGEYALALAEEMRLFREVAGERLPVHTIFFGGGTPSLLPGTDVKRILDELRLAYLVSIDAEITLEANPGTINRAYLDGLRELGVNVETGGEEVRITGREGARACDE